MIQTLFRRLAARAGAAAALSGAAPRAAGAQDYSYAFRVTPSDEQAFAGTARVSGDRARIDARTKNDDCEPADYLLLSDGGRTVTVVNPRERSYSVTDARSFEHVVATAMRAVNVAVSTKLSDVRISTEELGAGDTIAGHPTRRYRLLQEYTANVGVFGFRGDAEEHVVITDFWVAPGLTLMRNPLVEMLATTETALAQTNGDFVARSAAARDGLFRGMPLRLIVAARSSSSKHEDKRAPSRLVVEVEKVVRGPVDRAALDVPTSYHAKSGGFSYKMGS
jgi:hypothetical protein